MKASLLIKKTFLYISIFAVNILFCLVISSKLLAETSLFVEAVNAKGAWQKGVVTARKVIFADKPGIVSEIDINVPREGRYQLLAYVHHNWRNRNAFPNIRIDAIDSKGNSHSGSHMIENIWYLEENDPGRWFFVSLSDNPYWEFPEGRLHLKFWIEGKYSPWEDREVPLESAVSIYAFLLMPILGNNSDIYSSLLINPEFCAGMWNSILYHRNYGTNLLESGKKNAVFSCDVNIPISAYYKGWLSMLSISGGSMEIRVENKLVNYRSVINLKDNKEWEFIVFGPVYLSKGDYYISIKNLKQITQKIDFFVLLPE